MWEKAIETALQITKQNIERFGSRFPHVSQGDKRYDLNDNNDWTDGFWSGILWLSYEYSGDASFRNAAAATVGSFRNRLEQFIALDHHDIGFLYSPSAMAQWIIENDEEAKQLALKAADVLMLRWREKLNIFQAWGRKDDPKNGGRIIIDCLMNLPLLYWASAHTGNPVYKEAALRHAELSRRFLVRGDDSSYHTFYFDQETGDALRGGTHQGFQDGSTWTRGQAWGIYGFALAYRGLQRPEFLETSKRLARYFIERLPDDQVVYWDFDAPQQPGTMRDSSASAIAAAGMLELTQHMDPSDPERDRFLQAVHSSMASLASRYAGKAEEGAEGFLEHGSYSVRGGASPDDYVIWGDYFYLETLLRLEKGIPGYWYDRN
ncbi:glucuronyl hydrolase [Gordoniibacillus kamchatkensis]|uniref:Glucuronyl hydrolase n=1 Tax=Gordoniibacillus kamchatkensis TaxID=1590651 RepID=A0ABR5AHU4_9BACL|nr:glycoside hydrolase family 88 protein [Paenibacillus sp. VKM B-2647]KIL40584.1 glucuronyl hydrolase [Paenibacillus sp. VKM B-2647]